MLKPLQDFVLLETIPFEEVTASGLVLQIQNTYHIRRIFSVSRVPALMKSRESKRHKLIFRNGQEAKRWTEMTKSTIWLDGNGFTVSTNDKETPPILEGFCWKDTPSQ